MFKIALIAGVMLSAGIYMLSASLIALMLYLMPLDVSLGAPYINLSEAENSGGLIMDNVQPATGIKQAPVTRLQVGVNVQ